MPFDPKTVQTWVALLIGSVTLLGLLSTAVLGFGKTYSYWSGCRFENSLWIFERHNTKLVKNNTQTVGCWHEGCDKTNFSIQTIGLMHLHENGEIRNYNHNNERTWKTEDQKLVLVSQDGVSERVFVQQELPGVILRDTHTYDSGIVHQLRLQQPSDCNKLY